MPDGKIVFSTKIDNTQMAKDLKETERKIQKTEAGIQKAQNAKMPLVQEMNEVSAAIEQVAHKLDELEKKKQSINTALAPGADPAAFIEASVQKPQIEAELKTQEKEADKLQKKYEVLSKKVENYDAKIQEGTAALKEQQTQAGILSQKLSKGGIPMTKMLARGKSSLHDFNKRLLSIGKSAFVFSLVYAGLRGVVSYMGQCLNANDQYRAQLAALKGALITAFQPIYQFVLPGVLAVLRVITAIVQMFAHVLSFFGGKTAKQSADSAKNLNKEAGAIGGVGQAAKEAAKELAAFDELNVLGSETPDAGGGGAGGGDSGIVPDFSAFDTAIPEEKLRKLAALVASIGAGLLAWKITSLFTESLSMVAGIAMAVAGAVMYAFSWMDAFENEIDWENLTGLIIGLALAAGGLWLAFGPMGAAVALLVGGIGMVVLALHEWIKTGELSNAAAVALTGGILAIGGAIALMTGSWIPLAIAAVAAFVLGCITKADEMKAGLQKLSDWLTNVFQMDFTKVFGPGLGDILNGWFKSSGEIIDGFRQMLSGLIDFIHGVFTGNWREALAGIVHIFEGAFSSFVGIAKQPINAVIGLLNGLIRGVCRAVNAVTGMMSYIPGVSIPQISAPQIPYLARGAVLPPNKPFLAMVGDQTHGTNIEAPLETIKQAFREEGGGVNAQVLELLADIVDLLAQIRDGNGEVDMRKLSRLVTKYQRELARAGGV